jgi:hypothetical protein
LEECLDAVLNGREEVVCPKLVFQTSAAHRWITIALSTALADHRKEQRRDTQ